MSKIRDYKYYDLIKISYIYKNEFFNILQIKKEIFYYYCNFCFLNFFLLPILINVFGSTMISLDYLCYLISGFTSIYFCRTIS